MPFVQTYWKWITAIVVAVFNLLIAMGWVPGSWAAQVQPVMDAVVLPLLLLLWRHYAQRGAAAKTAIEALPQAAAADSTPDGVAAATLLADDLHRQAFGKARA